jgi:hypothetical protein
MLRSQENGLVRPRMWDDPFENFILDGTALASDGTKVKIGFRDSVYAQCWSFHIETDAMWRIYSPSKCGVKLKTTLTDLFMSLYNKAGEFRGVSCFIGKVQYMTKGRIRRALQTVRILDPTGVGIAETVLIKRQAFAPEKEVRLIYLNQRTNPADGVFKYGVDPNALIKDAVLDPRLKEEDADGWKKQFREAGFSGRIIQSGLYKPPKGIFINLPV